MGVVLVNGWTDAPNAIATCISTRSWTRSAIIMAAVFNFLESGDDLGGNATVAQTIYKMVDFGGNSHEALIALCAALLSIVLWATAAVVWYSTSESCLTLISGAAIAVHGGFAGLTLRMGESFMNVPLTGWLWRGMVTVKLIEKSSGVWTEGKPLVFLKTPKLPVPPGWPLCMVPRMDRNLWASLC